MVVNNKLFPIISIIILVIGVILSAVGITLIIVSSTTECTPIDSPSIVSTTTVSPPACEPQTCHSTMFGAQVPVADYEFVPALEDPTSEEFKQVSQMVSIQIITALSTPPSEMHMLISNAATVSYDVQVTRFTADDKGGTIAYTSGVAVSTAPIDQMPQVNDIQDTLEKNLPDTQVVVKEPSYECPACSCQTVAVPECPVSTECPTVIPTDSLDCSLCPISTECPSIPCPTTSLPNSTPCPTVIPTECPICPPEGITTECPSLSCPTSTPSPCDCPSTECPLVTECPVISTTSCPMGIPTDFPVCPPETIPTECPVVTCPTSSPFEWANATECPTVIPTECPITECPICPSEGTDCPSVTPLNTTECPVVTECPTIIPTDCSTMKSSDSPQDCSTCPSQFTDCPVVSTTEYPIIQSTDCPTVIPTGCPIQDCSTCSSVTSSSPSDCVTSTMNTTDCPSLDCSLCPTDLSTSFPSSSCPTISPTECNCPSTDSVPSTGCPTTDIPFSPTCHSTIFGAQLSLVETPWNTNLSDPNSHEFKEKADEVSKLLLNALDGSMNEMIILSSGDIKVTYNVQVDRFSPGSEGTIAYASGVAMSIAPIEDMPNVSDIRNTLNSSLGDDVTVENNELQFCSSYLFPSLPIDTTTLSSGTTVDKTTQSTIPQSTSQEPENTHKWTREETETTHPSSAIPQSSSLEPHITETTHIIPQTTTEQVETTQPSTIFTQLSSLEPASSQSTPTAQKSTTEGSQSTEQSTPLSQTSTIETQTTQLSSPVPQSTTEEVETTQPSSPIPQSTSNELHTTQSTPSVDQSTSHTSEKPISTTEEVTQSSAEQDKSTQFTTPTYQSSSQEPSHSSTFRSTTERDHTTEESSPSPSDISTTEELNGSSSQSPTSSSEQSNTVFSTPSFSTEPAHSTFETTPEDISTKSTEILLSTTEEAVHSSLSTQSNPSTTAMDHWSTLPSQTTTEQLTVLSTESLTTLPSTVSSTSQMWTSPSTVSCSGREVINGDVYLLFDYTLYDGLPDETNGIEDFITDILLSFDDNHFFLGKDQINGAQPLRFYLVHYPTDDENPYSKMLAKDVTSLEQLKSVMGLINQIPIATDSKMKEALDAIYAASNTNNPQSIVLISKSDAFVDEAKTISKQLQMDKKFNIIGVPLNGIDLTPLTNNDDIPLDVTSVDSQVETATNIDSVLMSISNVCLPSTPPPITTTSRYTTPSTPKTTTTISSASCDPSLDKQSIAFVYQANGDAPRLNSEIITLILDTNEIKDSPSSSFGALFPFPNTEKYPDNAAATWITLNDQRLSVFFNILVPTQAEIGANIADGLQSLIDHPDNNDVINNIVVIIANSADGVAESRAFADQLKETSTIITLSYGGDFDLSSLASSHPFALTQTTEDSTQAASLLLNSILQATCQ